MRGWLALLCAAALGLASVSIDPCKRQPFRGRCPSINGESPKRSQFVLRYYMRNSECVSYPFGHCVNDSNEPKLYRYKEECEDACINAAPGNLKSDKDQTYATLSPDQKEEQQKIAKMAFLDPNLIPQPEKPKIIESHPPAIEPTTTEASTTKTPSTTVKSTETPPTSTSTRKSTTTVQEKTTPEPRRIVPSGTTKTPRTECESRRAAASSASIKGGFIPTCNANGGFEKIQCEPDGRQCFCVNEKGIEIPNSRTSNAQRPDCEKIQSASTVPFTKECVGSPSRGPCQSHMTHWYYDEIEQKCKKFTYSGCGGNGNNYETQMACESRCAPPPIGLARCEKGEPLKTSIGVPVNCAKERCPPDYKCSVVQQSSVCCPDTVKTPVGEQTFVNSNVCQLPKDRGPCDKYELRFFYNSELKECKYFFWGGCGGNGNNFESANVCEETCIGGTNLGQDQSSDEFENLNAAGRTTQRPITIRTTQGIRITPNGPGNATEASNRHPTTTRRTTTARTNPTTTRRTTTTRHTTRPTTRRTVTPSPRTLPTRAKTTTTPIWKGDEEYEDGDSFGPEEGSDERQSPPAEPLPLPAIPDAILLEVNRCLHPKDPGPCKGSFVRWYWNADKKFCDVFTYNGCGGNGNNFASREECLAICHKEVAPVVVPDFNSVCNNDVDAGECNGVFQRFAFDTETGECRPFTYGGCGGNGNNFATMAECSNRCERDAETASNPCDADIEAGECSGVFARFGYDKGFNDCRHFTYGGCGGNGNNFATIQECRKTCVRKSCPPTPQCDLARCQLVNDRNGCPFCSCPPVKQPAASGSNCPSMNAADCEDPCIIITNRLGCQECKCPAESFGPEPPLSQIPERITGSRVTTTRAPVRAPPASHQAARPPASHSNAGPPAAPSTSSPQAPGTNARANSAKTIPGIDKNSISLSSLPENTSKNIKEKCLQPVDPGPCNHYIERWYFNTANGYCQPFNYGGCAGNHNHFFTQKECEIHCARFIKSTGRDESRLEEHRHQQFVTQPRQRQTLPPVRETTQTPLRAKSPIVAGTRTRIIESVAPPKPVQSVQTRPSTPPIITTSKPISNEAAAPLHPPGFDTHAPAAMPPTQEMVDLSNEFDEDDYVEQLPPEIVTLDRPAQKRPHVHQSVPNPTPIITSPPTPPQLAPKNIHTDEFKVGVYKEQKVVKIATIPPNFENSPIQNTQQFNTAPLHTHEEAHEFAPPHNHDEMYDDDDDDNDEPKMPVEAHMPQIDEIMRTEIASDLVTESTSPPPHAHGVPQAQPLPESLSPHIISTLSDLINRATQNASALGITSSSEVYDDSDSTSDERIAEAVAASSVDDRLNEFITASSLAPRPNTPSQTKPTLPPTPSTSNEPSTETTTSEFITTTEAPTTEDPLRKAVFANNDFNSDYVDPAFAHLQDITQIEDKYPREKVLKETVEVQRMQEADLKMDTGADQASLKRIEISPRGQLLHQHEQREHVVASPAHDSPTTSVDAPDEPLVAGDELPPQITGTDSEFAPPPAPVMITSKGMLHDEDEAMADLSDWSLEQQNGDVAPPGGFPEVNAAGKSIFEPDDTQPDPAELATAGREPVPRGPTGIAKAPQPELTDLEKSTTEAPSSVEVHPAPAPSTEKTPAFDAAVACNQPPDAGGCTNYVPRWFYNPQSGQCEQFSYGSCGGNLNNFADRSICESQCLKLKNFPPLPTRCTLHKDSGFGKGYHVKWYFNMKNLRCEQFVYEGDGGNENRFERLTDCEAICTAPKSGYRKTTVAESQLSTQPSTEQPITAKPKSPVEDYETEEKEDDIDLNEFFSSAIGTDKNILSEMAKSANKQGSSNEALPPAPAAQAAKTVGEEEIKAANAQEASKKEYKAEPVSSKLQPLGESGNFASSANANQPVVAPSPPVEIDYTLGGRKVQPSRKAHGLPNFGGADPIDFTEGKPNLERMPACPNGRIELKYPDGRSVNCLPGKNQCPDRSVCFFNGVDFFCCPNDDDPYDKHVFGGYDGEEAKHGYKVFGKLNIRRLMDEIPLRARRRRQTNRFDMDGAVAPMRFDSQNRPYTVSRAMRMKPKPPTRGNPMCIEPVVIGSCNEAHLRYFYDRATDTCRLFHYSGCDGNGNNFGSQSDCERLCVLNFEGIQDRMAQEVEQANQESITTTTHKPAPPGKCPDDATPLGGSSPVLCGNSTESIACPEGYFCSGGPPDICCPITEQQQKEVEQHFSPHGFVASQSNLPRGFSRHTFLAPPKFMCPDASDPMVDQTGQPVPCGAGFDGMKLCPRGYYCAIDSEKNSRLCCPLFGQASRIPAEEMTAPYYKKQKTPEVRERKRMPANPVIEEIKEVVESIGQQRQISPAELPASPQEEELGDDEFEDYQDEPGEFKHLKLKAEEPVERNKTTPTPKSDEEVSIDMGDSSQESPNLNEESISQAPKPKQSQQKDKSVCQLKPSEGRACREDEKAPRTNLHYFYSPTAKKCKLYFYKGCGGNDNRFEKKVDCEALCSEIRL